MKKLTIVAALAVLFGVQAAVVQNSTFKKSSSGWAGRAYWGGEVSCSNGVLVVKSTNARNRVWARAMGGRLRARYELPGRKYQITVRAKGSGSMYPGFLVYFQKPDGKSDYKLFKADTPVKLTGKFAVSAYTVDLTGIAATGLVPIVELEGEATAEINRIQVLDVVDKGASMQDVTRMTVVKKGEKAPAKVFKFSQPDAAVQTIQFDVKAPGKAIIKQFTSDADCRVTVPVKNAVNGLVKVVAGANGAAVTSTVLALDTGTFDELDALAAKVKAVKPVSILYIGDSLNDFDRSFNAVDQLEFFLNKYNPGKFTIYNYSVAGDYITRVLDRLTGKRSWDLRYNGIFDRKYDLVIIALGNNDTRALSSDDYKKPLVPAANIQPEFEKVISIIREQSNVPVWVFSASCSDYPTMEKKSLAATSRGRVGVRFGIAEHAKNFNEKVRAVSSAGKDIRYVDIYSPMKAAFDPANYADGVHLSLKGHTFYAKLLLQAFAGK